MLPIVERYHEILENRANGIRRYGGRLTSDLYGVPVRLSFPSISFTQPVMNSVRIGPLFFGDRPPVLNFILREVAIRDAPLTIAEIGPGNGSMARALQAAFGPKIERYVGIERDASVQGPYEKVDSVLHLPRLDVFVASEVIEHMTTSLFFEEILPAVIARMNDDGVAIIGTPNALSPASIFNDFTHVQGYNFFDLYGLMKLFFERVDIFRTRYVWSPERLLTLVPRIALCRALELDWCEGLICVGSKPLGQE